MKRKLITLSIAGALALGSIGYLQAGEHGEGRGHRGHGGHRGGPGMALERLTKELDLTPQQQAQVAPVIEQAKPQIRAIHEEAMAKIKALMEQSAAQIRPILTAEQQTKLDALQQKHARRHERHEAKTH